MAPPSSSSLSLPSSSPFSGSGVHGMATKWRRGVESSGHQGRGFIADQGTAEPGDWWMGIKGDRRRVLASNGREWLRGRGAKETGPCPGRDPPGPLLPALPGLGRRRERRGGGRRHYGRGWLTCGARVAAAASEVRAASGRVWRVGWLYSRAPCLPGRMASCGGGMCIASNSGAGLHRHGARGQGHALGVTPWPAPATAVGRRSRRRLRCG